MARSHCINKYMFAWLIVNYWFLTEDTATSVSGDKSDPYDLAKKMGRYKYGWAMCIVYL